MLFRGQNMLGYRPYADDAVQYFVQKDVYKRQAHMLRGMLKGTLCRMGQLFSPQESRSTNVATLLALLELRSFAAR